MAYPNPMTPTAIAAGANIFEDVSSAPKILLHKDSSSGSVVTVLEEYGSPVRHPNVGQSGSQTREL